MKAHSPLRLLALDGQAEEYTNLLKVLGGSCALERVTQIDQALAALRVGEYDAVLAEVGDFLPLERALVVQQASLVLDTIGEGVMVVDSDGRCAWSNKRMRSFPPTVIERAKDVCRRAREMFLTHTGEDHPSRTRKFTFQAEDHYFEMVTSPVVDDQGHIGQVVAVVWDATRGKKLEQKINAIDAAGRELAKLDSDRLSKLSPSQRLEVLRDKIIKFSKELMSFDHFAIRVVDKRTNKLELVIAEGLPPEAIEIDLYAQPEGNGISGYVASTGRSYICHDTEKDPRYVLGMQHGKSSLTVPLRVDDNVVGIFNIESERVGAFDEDDRQFAEIFGQYVAMALNILNLLVVERCTTTGLIADSVVQELAGPLNDIITDAESLAEDYIGEDTMRQRLGRIIEHAQSIRNIVRDVVSGTRTVLGAAAAGPANADPLLHGKRILIADDELNIRQTIGQILTGYGCRCEICKDGYEAIHMIEQRQFDLILSDIKMPHRNGYEIFAAARRRSDNVPVILMTGFGYDPHHSIVRASQEGLSTVLFKPFKVEQLMEEVRKALRTATSGTPGTAALPTGQPARTTP